MSDETIKLMKRQLSKANYQGYEDLARIIELEQRIAALEAENARMRKIGTNLANAIIQAANNAWDDLDGGMCDAVLWAELLLQREGKPLPDKWNYDNEYKRDRARFMKNHAALATESEAGK